MKNLVWTILTVVAYFLTIASSICLPSEPITNDQFKISCKEDHHNNFIIKIQCKQSQPWENFPWSQKLDLDKSNVTFEGCDFPQDLSLLNVTNSLNLGHVQYLEFKNLRSRVNRENIKGFRVYRLEFDAGNDISDDLLYDIVVEHELFLNSPKGWTTIPKDFFKNSPDLIYLAIRGNLTKIRRDDFDSLKNLQSLLLARNQIDEIEVGAFDDLVNLHLLEIGYNKLTTLPDGLLKNLVNLDTFDAYQNQLTHLPAGLLQIEGNHVFNKTRLNDNKISTLPDGFFKGLDHLTEISLNNNSIKTLPPDVFYNASALQRLNLSENELITLPPHLFDTNTHLKTLHLHRNALETLPDKIFKTVVTKDSEIRLDYNKLTTLTENFFFGMRHLRLLNISHNQLHSVGPICYSNINRIPDDKKIEAIDLSFNNLRTIEFSYPKSSFVGSIFQNCIKTRDLFLQNNKLSRIPTDWNLLLLKNVNLEKNEFTHIDDNDLSVLANNSHLNLRNNKITTVNFESANENVEYRISKSPNSVRDATIDLDGNPYNCDCKLISFVNYFKKNLDNVVYNYMQIPDKNVKCMGPPELKNVLLKDVNVEKLRCSYKANANDDACNELCTCYDYPIKKVIFADCSYRNLKTVPLIINIPDNYSIELNMAGNSLKEVPKLNQTNCYFNKVTSLDLSSNEITAVPLETFSPALRDLKLHNNSITKFEPEVLKYLLEDRLLRNLTLRDNKWICDCDFIKIVPNEHTPLTSQNIMCQNKNKLLSTITHNELCSEETAVIISVCFLVAIFGITIGGLAALYYKYQKEIKIWLYSKQWCLWFVTEDELDKDKLYDAFISFSHKDEDFVEKEMVARLEDGPRPYKLCLHYRDWLAGEWIPAQIARSVEESRRTIIILSPSFIESIWGRIEFRTAHHQALTEGRARVIIILYGDVRNFEDFDPELKSYLSMNTYVKWGDPWFWDKLRYALPHRHDPSRRRTRNVRIMENHLEQLTINYNNDKAEIIPVPKASDSSNDSAKLLDTGDQDDKNDASC